MDYDKNKIFLLYSMNIPNKEFFDNNGYDISLYPSGAMIEEMTEAEWRAFINNYGDWRLNPALQNFIERIRNKIYS